MHAAPHHPWHTTWWVNTTARDKSDRVGSFATDCRIKAIMSGLPRPSRAGILVTSERMQPFNLRISCHAGIAPTPTRYARIEPYQRCGAGFGPIAQATEMPLVTAPPVRRLSSSMVVGNTQYGWPAAA